MSAPLGLTDAQLNSVFCAAGIIPHHPSVRLKMQLNFWIDAADKSLTFADGARLRVIRFGPSWISGYRDDIHYVFNRSDGTLTFAGSTSEEPPLRLYWVRATAKMQSSRASRF